MESRFKIQSYPHDLLVVWLVFWLVLEMTKIESLNVILRRRDRTDIFLILILLSCIE